MKPIMVASFALGQSTEVKGDARIFRNTKLFEFGDYPDKNFSLTPEEGSAVLANVQSIPNELEHLIHDGKKTIFDGNMGEAENLRVHGNEIRGDVTIPEWVFKGTKYAPIEMSLAFDVGKRPVTNGLVVKGRIPDVKVLAAAFSESRAAPAEDFRKEGSMNTLKEWFKAGFSLFAQENGAPIGDPAPANPPAPPQNSPPDSELAAKFSAQQQEIEALRKASAERDAANAARDAATLDTLAAVFADEQISKAHKAMPAERDLLIRRFKRAVLDDNSGKVTCFSAEGKLAEGERVADIRKEFELRPVISVFSDHSKEFGLVGAQFPKSSEGIEPTERERLLRMTDYGRAVLAEEKR